LLIALPGARIVLGKQNRQGEEVNGKLIRSIFWALVGVFVVIAGVFAVPASRELLMGFPFIIISGIVFGLLGVALIFFMVKQKVGGVLKKFLLLTGASAVGIPVSIFLHNAIYGLIFVRMLDRPDFDEPFFFVMAIFVCPIGFLVGVVGSIILAVKHRQRSA
jgi:membrane associated rhomboid family serine protease|tara:strand:- start:698 stop:1183 length:486 start_codon:yes stop_codon:yes gene_type:complete